jgi:hypothetical protein
MNLLFLVFLGLLFLLSLPVALFRLPRDQEANGEAAVALRRMVSLPGLDFTHSRVLFDEADYCSIASEPRFKAIAEQLRRDRRRMALAWLGLLRGDVHTLWRFRRLLTRFGVSTKAKEESAVAGTAIRLLLSLFCLRAVVAIFGPFAFASAAAKVRDRVRGFSSYCGGMLARLPAYKLTQLESDWRNFGDARSAV